MLSLPRRRQRGCRGLGPGYEWAAYTDERRQHSASWTGSSAALCTSALSMRGRAALASARRASSTILITTCTASASSLRRRRAMPTSCWSPARSRTRCGCPCARLMRRCRRPKRVVAIGACAISGGVFGPSFAASGGVDEVIPVDVVVPGCPPPPLAILHGLLLVVERKPPSVLVSSPRSGKLATMNIVGQLFTGVFRPLRCRCRRGVPGFGPPEPDRTRDHRIACGTRRSGGERLYPHHWRVLPRRAVAGALARDADPRGRPALRTLPLHHRAGVPAGIDLLGDIPRKIRRASQPAIFQQSSITRCSPRSCWCSSPTTRSRFWSPGS